MGVMTAFATKRWLRRNGQVLPGVRSLPFNGTWNREPDHLSKQKKMILLGVRSLPFNATWNREPDHLSKQKNDPARSAQPPV